MDTSSDTIRSHLRILQVLHGAILSSQLLLGALFLYLGSLDLASEREMGAFLPFAVVAITVFNVFAGRSLYQARLDRLDAIPAFADKLAQHRQANIFRLGLLEGATIFNGIAYLLTGNGLFILLIAALVAFQVFLRPTQQRVAAELQLTSLSVTASPIQ